MTSQYGTLSDLHNEKLEAYFESAWSSLNLRAKEILVQRHSGKTLESIGQRIGVTRERVRQLEVAATKTLITRLKRSEGEWSDWCSALRQAELALNLDTLSKYYREPSTAVVFLSLVFESLGWVPQRKNSSWWIKDRKIIKKKMAEMLFAEPVPQFEWEVYRDQSGLPLNFIDYLIASGELPVEEFQGYIIRTKRRRRDRTHVFLLEHGPTHVSEIAEALGEDSSRALDGLLARQDIFTKVYPGGEWALTEFVDVKYKRATDAMLDMLEKHGPLKKSELKKLMSEVYPVSASRIEQCLTDFRIGKMSDGRIWLVEYGAKREIEPEPARPSHMHCSGNIVGIRREIDDDILRGSGLMDSRWLAWKLGLHSTPMSKAFAGVDGLPDMLITRAGSNCQLSSLREAVKSRGLPFGSTVVILLNLENSTWDIK